MESFSATSVTDSSIASGRRRRRRQGGGRAGGARGGGGGGEEGNGKEARMEQEKEHTSRFAAVLWRNAATATRLPRYDFEIERRARNENAEVSNYQGLGKHATCAHRTAREALGMKFDHARCVAQRCAPLILLRFFRFHCTKD